MLKGFILSSYSNVLQPTCGDSDPSSEETGLKWHVSEETDEEIKRPEDKECVWRTGTELDTRDLIIIWGTV